VHKTEENLNINQNQIKLNLTGRVRLKRWELYPL
jgi:hypothetical protein